MTMFQNIADAYDAMIDWPKRLAHEEPFYRRLFTQYHVRSVLDAACGTGRHAAMFHGWGLRVEGADVSPAMIARAQANFGQPDGLRFVVRGFEEPVAAAEPFDAVICVGNSLSLASDFEVAEQAIGQMLVALRPGGVLVVQVLNLWRLPDGPCVWQKCLRIAGPHGESLLLKGVHRCGSHGFVELIVTALDSSGDMQTDSTPLLGFEVDTLESMARRGGATDVKFFGGYDQQPFNRSQSVDLLMTAAR